MTEKKRKPGRIKSSLLRWLGVPISLTTGEFWQEFLGTGSASGKNVTVNSALQLSAVWACVNLLARTVASLPLNLYQRLPDGSRKAAKKHPLYRLLHTRPNADMTATTFRQVIMAHLLLWGNAYIEKSFSANVLVALTPLLPNNVTKRKLPNGSFVYDVINNGIKRTVREDRMMHIPGFTLDGYLGLSPIGMARQIMGSAMAADEASARVFANGMRFSGVFEFENVLNPKQREEFREGLEEIKGAINAGKTPLLEHGIKYKQTSMNPQDAQMLATREFSVEEICRWYGVPPHMIGHTSKATSWGTGIEQQTLGFLTFSVSSWLQLIEQAIVKDLIGPEEVDDYYPEHSVEGLLRADSAARAAYLQIMVRNGLMTRNEARAKENLPAIEGGDVLTVEANLVNLADVGKQGAEEAAKAQLRAWLGVVENQIQQNEVAEGAMQ